MSMLDLVCPQPLPIEGHADPVAFAVNQLAEGDLDFFVGGPRR
jgi:hypothetical protein